MSVTTREQWLRDQTKRRPGARPPDRIRELSHTVPVAENPGGHRMHRRLRISGVELGDDHHTLPPLFFVAPTPMLSPLLCLLLPGHLGQSSGETIPHKNRAGSYDSTLRRPPTI